MYKALTLYRSVIGDLKVIILDHNVSAGNWCGLNAITLTVDK